MAKTTGVWERGNRAWVGRAIDEDFLVDCESALGVKLPTALKSLYAEQNGGFLADGRIAGGLFALGIPDNTQIPVIKPLACWAEEGQLCDELDLRWLHENLGDASLVLPIWREGRTCYALNYNVRGADQEPNVIWIDFECGGLTVVANLFQEWLAVEGSRLEESLPSLLPGVAYGQGGQAAQEKPTGDAGPRSRNELSTITIRYEAVAKRLLDLLSQVKNDGSAESLKPDLAAAVDAYKEVFDSYLDFASSCETPDEIELLGRTNQEMFPMRHAISEELIRLSRHASKARRVLRDLVARLQDMDII
jgi:hypothetical protein